MEYVGLRHKHRRRMGAARAIFLAARLIATRECRPAHGRDASAPLMRGKNPCL
jgi:hypothetical protein